jgi:predicted nucleic acid-binding protein
MTYVLDCSFFASFVFPDEHVSQVEEFFFQFPDEGEIFVPSLFWYEITNVAKTKIKRKQVVKDEAKGALAIPTLFGVQTDFNCGSDYAQKIFELTIVYDLTAYDAAYLELASRKGATLGTLDDNLKLAAASSKLQIV